MLSHPGTSLSTVVAGKVVSDHEDVACRIVGFDVGKQRNVALELREAAQRVSSLPSRTRSAP